MMYPTMIGISECANSSGSSSRLWPSWMPVAIVASANSVPTARMKNSSAKRFSHSVLERPPTTGSAGSRSRSP